MKVQLLFVAVMNCLLGSAALAQPTVDLALTVDDVYPVFVVPGSTVTWSVVATVDAGSNAGLAGFSVDFVQSPTNPLLFDIPVGTDCTCVPSDMTGFAGPTGLTNPPPAGSTCGYCGTPVGVPGARDVAQIGGMQNTFQSTAITGGVGQQNGGQRLVQSRFTAPCKPGIYTFFIASPRANVLQSIGNPGSVSPTLVVSPSISSASFSITVHCVADFDHNGFVNGDDFDGYSIAFFLGDPAADIDEDGYVTGDDFDTFSICFDKACC